MRRVSIGVHALVVLATLAALGALWFIFLHYGTGSFWGGTLFARANGYNYQGAAIAVGTAVGLCVGLLSLGRLVQLLWPGIPVLGRWQGLRAAANTAATIVLIALLAELPDMNVVADPVRNALGHVFPGLAASGPPPPHLTSDSELDFPAVPIVREIDPLARLTLKDLDGKGTTLGDLRGKTVFLNIWATWCGPCRAEMPNIEALYESLKDEPDVVFALASNEEPAALQKFLKENPHRAPVYAVEDDALTQLGVSAFPTTLVLSKDGQIAFRKLGSVAWDGGTTKAFLLALAHDTLFTPSKTPPTEVK